MVAIAPFKALRYNLERVALSDVICPPYDIIAPAAREQLCRQSPYNFVRLELPDEGSAGDRYGNARQMLETWTAQGIVVRDSQPAIYLSEHTFAWGGQAWRRLGWVALLSLDGPVTQEVLSHEATFEAPKADRAKLLEGVRAQLSPIFCVVRDPEHQVRAFLQRAAQACPPIATAEVGSSLRVGTTSGPETIRLWSVTDPETIAGLQQRVAGSRALIADGHHRFAVALAHRRLCGGVMTYFACAHDPAVQVHPIHRVVRLGGVDPEVWQKRLTALCDWHPVASFEEGMDRLGRMAGAGRFLYYHRHQAALVQAREAGLAELDVTILHHRLLPCLAGSAVPDEAVRYTPDLREAVQMADEGQGDCVWGLRPIPLTTVFELASQRLALPQKSTYFYPKALAGLVIYPLDPALPRPHGAGQD